MAFAPALQFPAAGPWTLMMIHSNLPSAMIVRTLTSVFQALVDERTNRSTREAAA
jgi:hypothetical protein